MERALRSLAVIGLLVASAANAAPDARIQLVPRAALVGDGERVVPLELRVITKGEVGVRASVRASSGKVVAGPVLNGVAVVAFTPPRVRRETAVRFSVVVRVNGKRLKEKLVLKVVPPGEAPSTAAPSASDELPFDPEAGLKIHLRPTSLILEREKQQAEVIVDVGGAGEIEDLAVATNTGTVSSPQPTENPRRFRAVYQPADVFFPHVAILRVVAVVDGERRVGWSPLRLWGKGAVTVKALPGTAVRLTLAGKVFGPKKADGLGRAKVPVEVPPGYDTATYRKKPVPVKVVPFLRAMVWPERDALTGDGSVSTPVRIFAVTPRGDPLEDVAELRVESEGVRTTPPERVEPGVFRIEVTRVKGEAAPRVSVGTIDGEARATTELRVVGGAPSLVELEISANTLIAGASPARLSVRVLDATGNASDVEDIAIEGAALKVGAVRKADTGVFEVSVAAPRKLPAERETTLSVRAGAAVRNLQVTLAPGPAARISLTPPEGLIASGARVALSARVVDAFDNDVGADQVTATAERGVIEEIAQGPEGLELGYRTPLAYERLSDPVTLASGDQQRTFDLGLVARERGFTVGAHAGWTTNLASVQAPAGGLDVGWRFANADLKLLRGLGFVADLSVWHDLGTATTVAGPVDTALTVIPLGIGVRYEVPFLVDGRVSLGVLGTGALINSEVRFEDKGAISERLLAAGGTALVGVGWRLGPGVVLLQVRGEALALGAQATGEGLLWGLGARAGYRVPLF